MTIACTTCAYWQPPSRPARETAKVFRAYEAEPQQGPKSGQCRRFPPTLQRSGEDLRSVWPLTAAWHWCGEHAVDAAQAKAVAA